jgi:hypothetical protein
MYKPYSFSRAKYIIGVCKEKSEAVQHQKNFCGLQYTHGSPEGVIRGFTDTEVVTFIREYKHGEILEQP